MAGEITTINLWETNLLLRRAGGVNCYLVKTSTGFILIDTGYPSQRAKLFEELEHAGCRPGNLWLILITHGDLDHSGNGACLREKYGSKIVVHPSESAAVENADMALNRKTGSGRVARLFLALVSVLGTSIRLKPDAYIEEGSDLSRYGLDAKVLHIPGHSQGSIGVLTADGNLFCGDLLLNIDRPAPSANIDDLTALHASIERLKHLPIGTIYPGHGKPFQVRPLVEKTP